MSDIGDLDHQIVDLVSFLPDIKKYKLLRMLEDWRQGQSRGEYREPCIIPVDINFGSRVTRDFIMNYSSWGAFIVTRESFNKGQPVLLAFSSPDGKWHYKVAGIIVRKDRKGIAIKFNQKIKKSNTTPPKNNKNILIEIVKR